jgi:hypothetical protein
LENGKYPLHLKNRIRSGQGHLSNRQALELFITHRPPFMTHLILSHLSKENNTPQLAKELFMANAGTTSIIVASRDEASLLYTIADAGLEASAAKILFKPIQLGLFE